MYMFLPVPHHAVGGQQHEPAGFEFEMQRQRARPILNLNSTGWTQNMSQL